MKKSLFVAILLFAVFATRACAEDAQNITVAPSLVQLDLQHDQPQTTLTYKNNAKEAVDLSFAAEDFTQLEDGYRLSFLDPKNASNYKFGLSSWIDFSTKTVTLDPGEATNVTVFVDDKKLTPGGHYASILAHFSQHTADKTITLQGTIVSLLFVRTATGREIDSATTQNFQINTQDVFWGFPEDFVFGLQNTGDTTLTPYGTVDIRDPLNRLVERGIVNDGSVITLPESIRRYAVPIRVIQTPFLPGMYQADLTINYGKTNKKIHQHITFFSQGSLPLFQTVVGLLLVLGLIFFIRRKIIRNLETK